MILFILLGGGLSLVLGVFVEGARMWATNQQASVFLYHGVGCALVFALHQWRGLLLSILISLMLAGIYGFTMGPYFVQVFITSAVALLAMVFTGEFMWGKTFLRALFGRFLYVGLVLAVAAMLSTIVLALAYGEYLFSEVLVNNIIRGGLIGVGLGFGFELAELITGRSRRRAALATRGSES
ncbi:hypothetical protein GF377_00850 [candidate division GN15 bacterium]|nr:hypothetical protein [candidate division GN15 bacterium]